MARMAIKRRTFMRTLLSFSAASLVPVDTFARPLPIAPAQMPAPEIAIVDDPGFVPRHSAYSNLHMCGIFLVPQDEHPITVEVACGPNDVGNVMGMRSFMPPDVAMMTQAVATWDRRRAREAPRVVRNKPLRLSRLPHPTSWNASFNRLMGPADLAYFNTDDCWCPFDFGLCSARDPLKLTFEAIRQGDRFEPINVMLVYEKMPADFMSGRRPGLHPVALR